MVEVQVAAVAGEVLVVRLADLDQQVTRHASGRGGVALSAEVELHAVLDAGRDFDLDDRLFPAQAMLVGILGLGFDAPPQAAASGAGGGRLHLAEDGVGDAAHLAGAPALAAGVVLDPFGLDEAEHLDLLGHALGDLLEGQLDLDAQVGPLHPARAATATAESTPEGAPEDVAELAEDVVHVHAGTASRSTAHSGVTEAVVLGPLLLVAQDLIGLGRLLEPGLGIGVVGVLVGVVLDGQLPIGLLDVGIGCPPVDAEDLVEIALGHGAGQLPTTTFAKRRTLSWSL